MTERPAATRTGDAIAIGPSHLRWHGDTLEITIDEVTAPLPSRLRGTVRVHPTALTARRFTLDDAARHHWSPIAPACRVEAAFTAPSLHWSGPGYLDSNAGTRPLEDDFSHWDWCRAALPDGAAILYNASRKTGGEQSLALAIDESGAIRAFPPPPPATLPPTRLWRIPRPTRADGPATIRQTLEDTPFYARSLIDTHLLGHPVTAVHESLSMTRFTRPWVQAMLPFRIPRWR